MNTSRFEQNEIMENISDEINNMNTSKDWEYLYKKYGYKYKSMSSLRACYHRWKGLYYKKLLKCCICDIKMSSRNLEKFKGKFYCRECLTKDEDGCEPNLQIYSNENRDIISYQLEEFT